MSAAFLSFIFLTPHFVILLSTFNSICDIGATHQTPTLKNGPCGCYPTIAESSYIWVPKAHDLGLTDWEGGDKGGSLQGALATNGLPSAHRGCFPLLLAKAGQMA